MYKFKNFTNLTICITNFFCSHLYDAIILMLGRSSMHVWILTLVISDVLSQQELNYKCNVWDYTKLKSLAISW